MKITKTSILTVLVLYFSGVNLFSQDATSIINKLDKLLSAPKDRKGTVEIVTTNKSGKTKVREAEMFQIGQDKKIYRYTKPESQAGIATLTLPGGIMWMYMPALGKPKKISMLANSAAFNNTDFSTEDMDTRPYADRFSAKLLETTADGFVLELKPKYEKSQYSKLVMTVDKENYYPEKIIYYDKSGKPLKEATYHYQKSGGYWYAAKVVMKNLKKDHTTQITFKDIKFDNGLPEDMFTVEKLAPPKNKEK